MTEVVFDPAADAAATTAELARRCALADTDFVLIRAASAAVDPLGRKRLCAMMGDDVAAVSATIVHGHRPLLDATPHDGRVRNRGVTIVDGPEGVPRPRARSAGRAVPDLGPEPAETEPTHATTASCVLVRTEAVRAVGGIRVLGDVDATMIHLCIRLREDGWTVAVADEVVVVDDRPVASMAELYEPVATDGTAWRQVVEDLGPRLRAGVPGRLRIAITTAVPSVRVQERWGDWHLAHALADALGRAGHDATVRIAPDADELACRASDVHLVVRGLADIRRSPGQLHVVWVVSHPESVTTAECDGADLVLVASERFADALRRRTSTPVAVLLQATDEHRFRPVPTQAAHRHQVTVVAKSQERRRDAVEFALAAGIRPAIYGSGWDGLVDPELVVCEHVPNDELPTVYCSADVVLNDHWETMRVWGFVSNRIFDVIACGTPVISDEMPEIAELFDDAVATYRDPDSLRARVDDALADPAAARSRAETAQQVVLARHTFDHRATELLDLVTPLLDSPPGDSRSDEPGG